MINLFEYGNFSIDHIFRESNMPADILAKMDAEGLMRVWRSHVQVPKVLRGLLRTDKLHLSHLRLS